MDKELIKFACEACAAPLEIEAEKGGRLITCPDCAARILVPMPRRRSGPAQQRRCQRPHNPTVPVKLGLPGGPGMEAQVSRQDAGKLAFTFLGAILAIVGVIFGIRMAKKS